MRLGFAVKVLGAGGLPSQDTRRWQSGPPSQGVQRLSTHPGQYVVLNSVEERIVDAAVRDLELQAELFDAMGLGPEAVVNIHVGGAPDGIGPGLDRFEAGWERLSPAAQRRVVIENDDRTYALGDVLALSKRIYRPVVWDILHHHCHDLQGIPDHEALRLALATWPDGVRPEAKAKDLALLRLRDQLGARGLRPESPPTPERQDGSDTRTPG